MKSFVELAVCHDYVPHNYSVCISKCFSRLQKPCCSYQHVTPSIKISEPVPTVPMQPHATILCLNNELMFYITNRSFFFSPHFGLSIMLVLYLDSNNFLAHFCISLQILILIASFSSLSSCGIWAPYFCYKSLL